MVMCSKYRVKVCTSASDMKDFIHSSNLELSSPKIPSSPPYVCLALVLPAFPRFLIQDEVFYTRSSTFWHILKNKLVAYYCITSNGLLSLLNNTYGPV